VTPDVGGETAAMDREVSVFLSDDDDSGRRKTRSRQIEAWTGADQDARAHSAEEPQERYVSPETAPVIRVVLRVHQDAREAGQQALDPTAVGARPLVVEDGDGNSRWEVEERRVCNAPEAD
jgi:hypothetical protein